MIDNILDIIRELEVEVLEIPGLFTKSEAEQLSMIIKGMIISKALSKQELEQIDVDVIQSIVDECEYTVVHKDFVSLVLAIKDIMRENSHGAVILDRVYIDKNLYNNVIREFKTSKGSAVTICGVKTFVSDSLSYEDTVIGLGKPKYEGVSAKSLVIKGYIK